MPIEFRSFTSTRRRLLAVIVIATALVAPLSVARADFKEGQVAYQEGHYATAFRALLSSAERGNAVANALIGNLYRDGLGVAQDYAATAQHYHRGAEGGSCPAMFALARMYHLGRGVAEDPAEAAKWYRSAAERGHTWAQFDLATFHEKGLLVPRDPVQAYFWYDAVASDPQPGQDFAVTARRRVAARSLEIIYNDMTPDQIAEALRLIDDRDPDPKACETGLSASRFGHD
jgi:hypothetical protein